MKAIRLRTEYLKNPFGIDIQNPRLFWNCEGGKTQTAYQVICKCEEKVIWDSGKVESQKMQTVYPKKLSSGEHITWQIRLWDEANVVGAWSEEAFFEMGLLEEADWKAKWICGNYPVNQRKRYPVDCFRKEFSVDEVKEARLYITACGLYEVCINGKRVGEFVMAPGHTDYRKRIAYQTYDVNSLLNPGENVIEILLADGWYRGSCGAWGIKNQYGIETKVLCQLELLKNNREKVIIKTDESWQWSNDGEIRFADNQDGEIVDSRKKPSYDGFAKVTNHSVMPSASNNVAVKEQECFQATVVKTPSGKTVLDFGQNIAGYIEFKVAAKEGQTLFLRFGEMFDENGEFTQNNIQCRYKEHATPLQQIEYICKEGENFYKTRFAVFGFRYVLLETNVEWNPKDFTAIAVYSDMEQTGFFESSHTLLNQFVENALWSSKGNFLDVPTDCPTRERHSWTGDSQIFFDTASYFFDYAAFAKKHLKDVFDWQRKNGNLPQIAPEGGVDFYMYSMNGASGWSDIGILMPYRFWKKYGDVAILKEFYPKMKQYAKFLKKRCGKKTLLSKPLGLSREARKYAVNYGQSYGEWAEPKDVFPNQWTDMVLPHPEVSTAYTSYCFQLMSEIAGVLADKESEKEYKELAEKVKKSYQAMRHLPEFSLDTDRQAMLVRPLAYDLLDEEQTSYAKKRLIEALESYGWRLGTGFLSTPLILDVLTKIDTEAAYHLLENEEMPGWLFMPKSGATTIWESWEGTEAQGGIGSLNHYSKGAACAWLFESMCGIKVDGENRFIIEPHPGGTISYAKASYQSIYGKVVSSWEKKDGKVCYHVSVPSNCEAEVRLPKGTAKKIFAGQYEFEEA